MLLPVLACMAQPAFAQQRTFDVPEQPAVAGIRAFAKQAGVQIVAPTSGLGDQKTHGVKGAFTVEEGLAILLKGTGLQMATHSNGVVSLAVAPKPVAPPAKPRPGPVKPADAPVGEVGGGAATPVETVVVTGTRIARPELQSTMPIAVIHSQDAKDFARDTVYDALLLNPAIGPGLGEMNSLGQEYDQGVANINLRNLGPNRSLVLVDGERWVSSGARTSAVDLNTIPTALIDRFEVVTGGAAAIYGADAVTGVVNVIMKTKLSGVDMSATSGISSRGDANQDNVSVATGGDYADGRGHFVIGGDYTYTAPLSDESRYSGRVAYYPNAAYTGPGSGVPANLLYTNIRQINRSSVPTFCLPSGTACKQWYQLLNGVVTPVPQSSYQVLVAGEVGVQNGGPSNAGNAFENLLLRPEAQKGSLYAHTSYALTPTITWSGMFSYARSADQATPEWPQIRDDERPTNWWGGTTAEIATLTNPYLPASLRQFMLANNLTSIPLDRTYLNLPRAYEYDDRENITLGSNLDGKLTNRLNWQAFVRYGQVSDDIETTHMIGKAEWLNARNTLADPVTGQIECADATARANGCQPLNFFSTAPYSQSLLNYLERSRHESNFNSLLTTGASINGSLFSLPAGDVSTAAGFEWRRETLRTRDDPDTAKLKDVVFSPGEDYALHPALDASRDTTEVFGEVLVPVLRDLPLVKHLSVEGAYRYSHYSDSQDTHTWKAGGTWELLRGLTLRGDYSHSVRVPNFGELFSPPNTATYGNIPDPCQSAYINQNPNYKANCTAVLSGLTVPLPTPNLNAPVVHSGGNPDLTPETSNSFTYGAVFQPRFAPGFDLTIDYWDITISSVITQLPYITILNNCYGAAGGPGQFYCNLISRDTQGNVVSVQALYENLSGEHARGVDFGANYRTPVAGGLYRASFNATYLAQQTIVAAVGQPGVDYAGEWDFPRFKFTLLNQYSFGKFSFGINTRYISRSKYNSTAVSNQIYQYPFIGEKIYNDLTLTYRPVERYDVTFGVKNVADTQVPLELQANSVSPHSAGSYFGGSGAADYDAIGRYFFVKFNAHF